MQRVDRNQLEQGKIVLTIPIKSNSSINIEVYLKYFNTEDGYTYSSSQNYTKPDLSDYFCEPEKFLSEAFIGHCASDA